MPRIAMDRRQERTSPGRVFRAEEEPEGNGAEQEKRGRAAVAALAGRAGQPPGPKQAPEQLQVERRLRRRRTALRNCAPSRAWRRQQDDFLPKAWRRTPAMYARRCNARFCSCNPRGLRPRPDRSGSGQTGGRNRDGRLAQTGLQEPKLTVARGRAARRNRRLPDVVDVLTSE